MRARNIKPEFFRDRKIGRLGPYPALVYQALWCLSDDGGTAPCDPDHIKGVLFYAWPDMTVEVIAASLAQLASDGRIRRYRRGDDTFCDIPTLLKHNNPKNPSDFRNLRPVSESDWLDPITAPEVTTTQGLPQEGGTDTPPLHLEPLHPPPDKKPVAADAPTRTPEPVGLAVVEGNTLLGALERAPDLPTTVPPDPPPRPPGMGLVRGGSAAVQRFSAGSYADVTGHLGVVLAEVTTGAARRFRADEKREVMALMLGAYWAAKLHRHPERVKFTKRRVSQLVRVLRENEDDLSELFYVVDGAVRDDYCQGRTQKQHGEKVIELDFLFGSRDRIERLAGHCAGYKAGETHPRVRQIVGGAASGEVVNG